MKKNPGLAFYLYANKSPFGRISRLGQLMEFNADASFFEEADLEGIRIGIVHTITEVTDGEQLTRHYLLLPQPAGLLPV